MIMLSQVSGKRAMTYRIWLPHVVTKYYYHTTCSFISRLKFRFSRCFDETANVKLFSTSSITLTQTGIQHSLLGRLTIRECTFLRNPIIEYDTLRAYFRQSSYMSHPLS